MSKTIPVTTGDLKQEYEILSPVYFQVSNKGLLSSQLSKLIKEYQAHIKDLQSKGQFHEEHKSLGNAFSTQTEDFDKAFFIAIEELRKRAITLGADAVIGMRQDIDIDPQSFLYFYLQMYGTAIKFIQPQD